MSKLFLALALAATLVLAGAGCKHAGSREYTPGKGWQQN
jgi:hypothetical protein